MEVVKATVLVGENGVAVEGESEAEVRGKAEAADCRPPSRNVSCALTLGAKAKNDRRTAAQISLEPTRRVSAATACEQKRDVVGI